MSALETLDIDFAGENCLLVEAGEGLNGSFGLGLGGLGASVLYIIYDSPSSVF